MKKIFSVIFILMVLSISSYANNVKHILVLHSYHQTMSWVDDMNKAIDDVLEPSKNNYMLHVEYMDTKRKFSKEYLNFLKKLYRLKYPKISFDIILTSDNNAYDFLKKNRDELFGEIPVVFCGVNFFKNGDLKDVTKFTGVAEIIDAKATVNTALKLYPNTKKIFNK